MKNLPGSWEEGRAWLSETPRAEYRDHLEKGRCGIGPPEQWVMEVEGLGPQKEVTFFECRVSQALTPVESRIVIVLQTSVMEEVMIRPWPSHVGGTVEPGASDRGEEGLSPAVGGALPRSPRSPSCLTSACSQWPAPILLPPQRKLPSPVRQVFCSLHPKAASAYVGVSFCPHGNPEGTREEHEVAATCRGPGSWRPDAGSYGAAVRSVLGCPPCILSGVKRDFL